MFQLFFDIGPIYSSLSFTQPLCRYAPTIKKKATNVFAFIRTSPDTQNTGIAQGMIITTCCLYLRDNGVIPHFDTIRPFLCKEVDRRSVVDSNGLKFLVDAISKIDANESIYIVATSMIRIGIKYEDITSVMTRLVGKRKNVVLLFLDSYGINHDDHAHEVSAYHSSLDKLCCNHIDAGKWIAVAKEFDHVRVKTFANGQFFYDQWIIADTIPLDLQDAVTRGKQLPVRFISVRKWLADALSAMKNNPKISVEKLVVGYPYQYKGEPHQGVVIYARTSPKSFSTTVSDLPAYQLSRCFSYYSDCFKERELAIIYDKWKRREYLNDGFANVVTRIFEREISHVIVNTTNRISSSSNKILLFHEICRVNKVQIHYVSHLGMDVQDVLNFDCKRLEQRQAALKRLQDSLRVKVDHKEEIHQIRIRCLSELRKCNLCVCGEDENIEQNTSDEMDDHIDD